MRHSLMTAATVVALALTLAPAAPTTADPGDRPDLPPAASDTARERAEEVLARAEEAIASSHGQRRGATRHESGVPEPTMVLNQLFVARPYLDREDRARAEALLARPVVRKGISDGYLDYGRAPNTSHCSATICIHYVTDSDNEHAPDLTDESGTPAPDAVEQVLATAEQVHDAYLAGGYRPPDPDGKLGGGKDKVDIYLGNLGDQAIYGYCTSDQPDKSDGTWNYWAYCAIDNDFAEFAGDPQQTRQVTLAHEYFHAIQFAYDAAEDPWFKEATATWAEDELFDDVDDNRQYLGAGQIRIPRIPLDTFDGSATPYGNWIFFRYLTERWSAETGNLPALVRDLWERASDRAGDRDHYSTQAIQRALAERGTSFTDVYGRFAALNRHPARTYEEGAAYPRPRLDRRFTLGRDNREVGRRTLIQDHLSHRTVRYRPGQGTRRLDWRLRVDVNMPGRRTAPVARLVVSREDGSVAHRVIRLDRKGNGHRTIRFSSRRVRTVDLLLINASRRMRCREKNWFGGFYACGGFAKDDYRRSAFRARTFRR
jgi:hypothetical protein